MYPVVYPEVYPEVAVPPSLPEHVRRLVETDIVTGSLEPSTRITEEQLANRYAVSRTPVREAMQLLEHQGLLVRRKGVGARKGPGLFVAARTTRDEVEVVYQVRQSVESFLTERAAASMTEATLARLELVHDKFQKHLRQPDSELDIATLVALDSEFHWAIYDSSDSDLTGVVRSYWGRLQRELAQSVYEASPPQTYADQHQDILNALRDGDAQAAREHMLHHLAVSSDAILAAYSTASGERS